MKKLKAIVLIITLITGVLGVVTTDKNTNKTNNIKKSEYSVNVTESITEMPAPTSAVENTEVAVVPEKVFLVSSVQALSVVESEPMTMDETISNLQELDVEIPEIPEIVIADINDSEDPEPDKTQNKGTVTIKKENPPTPKPVKKDEEQEKEPEEEKDNSSVEEKTIVKVGIDVSKWNGKIDWKKVADSGVEFAMIRTGYRGNTYGNIVADPLFYDNIEGALANGIEVGVYFYSQAVNVQEAKQEAAWVCQIIEDYNITYPVAYDLEEVGKNRIKDVSYSQLNKNARAFLDYVNAAGYRGSMYGCKSYMETVWNMDLYSDCHIWLAHYTGQTTYSGRYDMWQYTDSGKVDGISTSVDLNYAYIKQVVTKPGEEDTEEPLESTPEIPEEVPDTPEETPNPDMDEPTQGFVSVDEKCIVVVSNGNLNVRELPNLSATIIGSLQNGAIVHRIAVSEDGWSEIEYDNAKAYVSSDYLKSYSNESEGSSENNDESSSQESDNVSDDEEGPTQSDGSIEEIEPSITPAPAITDVPETTVTPEVTDKSEATIAPTVLNKSEAEKI